MTACTDLRDRWLTGALDPGAVAGDAHLAACGACRAWVARRRDHVLALGGVEHRAAPAALEDAVRRALAPESTAFEARLARRLGALEPKTAPDVLARLVAEELADPAAARVRRFVGDLDDPATPGRLEHRLSAAGGLRRRARRGWAWGSLAAAALLAVSLILLPDDSTQDRSFEVRRGRPDAPSPLAAGLVDGWTGGMLSARRGGAAEEGR